MLAYPHARCRVSQRGVVAIVIALALAVLVGFAGIVLDLGRLFVNKTELQNAADACALAAANQLVCDSSAGPCPAGFLADAEAAGIFVGARNANDFQDGAVTIDASDVRFAQHIDSEYLPRASNPPTDSKFVKCTARSAAIPTRFMQVLKTFAPVAVSAHAVATLAPGQTACNASPIGICAKDPAAADFGYGTIGEWITSRFNNGVSGDEMLEGNFRWVDYTPSAGGTDEIRDQLLGNNAVCGIAVGDDVRETGVKHGSKNAWNTRFGINPPGGTDPVPLTVSPDKTGFSYPSKDPAIPVGTSAYADYRLKQAAARPFDDKIYTGDKVLGTAIATEDHLKYGSEKRLVSVPLIECGKSPATVKILGMGCALMLNPMSAGATGNIYLEWRGLASLPGSPCRSSGVAGGTDGPLVPTLVQ